MPTVVVVGVGAIVLPVPPVAAVYHFKLEPDAVKILAVVFWQCKTGVDTEGGESVVFIVTTTTVLALSQPFALV